MIPNSRGAQSGLASFSPVDLVDAETDIGPTASRSLDTSILPAPEEVFRQTQDIAYCNGQNTTAHTLQGTLCPLEDFGGSFAPPMSFRERHWFLHGIYNSILDPCAISAKDLDHVSRRAGLSMEEVLSWFEDEKSRRMEILLACQIAEPRKSGQQLPMSPATTTTSGFNGTVSWSMAGFSNQSPGTSMQSDETFPLLVPSTISGSHISVPPRAKRGRPPKIRSSTLSVSPSPEAKRQKFSIEYPCPDCSKLFPSDRWSEHVKRVHFPDHIWECRNVNGRTGKPCTSKPFPRPDNFGTHLRSEHGCTNEGISRLKVACKLRVVNFFHEKCGFLGCDNTFKTRDESIEHIKDHFREFAQSARPPKDLGLSQWKEKCASDHVLKRGVHYHVSLGMDHKNTDEDQDRNHDNEPGDRNSSNEPHNNSGPSPDERSPPGGGNNSSDSAGFDSSQNSSYMEYGQYSAFSKQAGSGLETDARSSKHTFGLENLLLPFTIRRRLGFGGHGLVDEVFSISSRETFARKSVVREGGLSDNSTQMLHLKNELSILKELSHPHLVKLIGAYADAKYSHIIMSPVADQNLAHYMLSSQSDRQPHLIRWIGCLASAMGYLHDEGIQHLDVKPQNVLLKEDNVLLADFGTAKSLNGWPVNLESLAVTPMYCAPETMLYGRQENSSDIFALGCVFSEMMTRYSGRSLGDFEEFRSKNGTKAFHLTIPEVADWITLLPVSTGANGIPFHRTQRQTQFCEKIVQMLAEVSSERPKARELQSCFMDVDCHLCKSSTIERTAALRPVPQEYEFSSTPETIPSGGSAAVNTTLVDSESSTDNGRLARSADNASGALKMGHVDELIRDETSCLVSPLSQSLGKPNLSTRMANEPSHHATENCSQSPTLPTEDISTECAEKSQYTCPECGKVFKNLAAHMLSHQKERPHKCPIQTCEYYRKGFARIHDRNRHVLSHYEGTILCRFCPLNKSIEERLFNRTDVFKRHLTNIHGVTTDGTALSGQENLSEQTNAQVSDETGICPTCDSTFTNAVVFCEHLDECVLRAILERNLESSVSARLTIEGKTNSSMPETGKDFMHGCNSYTHATEQVAMFSSGAYVGTGMDAFALQRHRTYSDHSSDASGKWSDSPLYSTMGDPRTPETEFADDHGALDEDAKSVMPFDQKMILSSLTSISNPEPTTLSNPYETVSSDAEPVTYQDSIATHPSQSMSQPLMYALPTRPANMRNLFDGPWTPIDHRVPSYPAGFVAFAPSPGPHWDCDFENCRSEPLQFGEVIKSMKPRKIPRSSKRKGKADSLGWEHIVVAKDGLKRVSEIEEEGLRKGSGFRSGKLAPALAEKARRMRKIRACWSCWIQKVPCSDGQICVRCAKISSPLTTQLCWRSGFRDYEATFFPEFLHSHLRKSKVEDLISDHTKGFLDTVLIVEVSTGSVFKPMNLSTNAFLPKSGGLLSQSSLIPSGVDQVMRLVQRISAPVGILGLSLTEMRKKCKNHIEDMISNPQYAAQVTAGDISQMPRQILDIVCEYALSATMKDVPLLQNALKLHAIHYFMSCLVTFSERSACEIYTALFPSTESLPPYLSSRLLNRQIKYAMHKLHREITVLVLEDLERSLRSRTKDSWGPSFCTILILCLCIENLQCAADMLVVCDLKIYGTGGSAQFTRDLSRVACEQLDDYPFQQSKKLFHDIYRTHKSSIASGGSGAEKGFNPLIMAAREGRMGLDACTEGMVRAIYGVVRGSWDEILALSERPAIVDFGLTIDTADPSDIKVNSTGRLAAKFLRSFFPDD